MRKLPRLGITIACSLLAGAGVYLTGESLQRPAWPVYDLFQRLTAKQEPKDVALVLITQAALDDVQKQNGFNWPWPREFHGALMTVAGKLGAKSVTFDINFATPSSFGLQDDQKFNQAIRDSQVPVVMPGPDGAKMSKGPNATIKAGANIHEGSTIFQIGSDGVTREMPAIINGKTPLSYALIKAPNSDALKFYKHIEAVDYSNVLHMFRAIEDGKPIPPELGADKLRGVHWVVGAAAPGMMDLKPTPLDPSAPGPSVHATALANALEQSGVDFLSKTESAMAASVGAFVVFAVLLFTSTPIPALTGAAILTIAGPFVFSFLLWLANCWFNPLAALVNTGVIALIVLATRFQMEWKERQRLAKSIENAMSADMVNMIRKGKLKLARFGERREISIFFCDLSGFTTISENLDAATLVEVLNMYLEETVNLIFLNRGYVDKFIGDAVMALWGAPAIEGENHAVLALESAMQFQDAFAKFRERAKSVVGESANQLSARVGVHSGTAIVGNIGANNRYNYTAIGDPVNLASRLEGLGKQYDAYLLISEEMLIAAQRHGDPRYTELDLIAVKGKSTPTRIFTYDPKASASEKSVYAKALDFYRLARFAEALEIFETIPKFGPAKKMAERCRKLLADGTGKTYQAGVWYFDEK